MPRQGDRQRPPASSSKRRRRSLRGSAQAPYGVRPRVFRPRPHCLQGARVRWSRRIPENADPSHPWDSLGHHLQSLGGELGKQHRHSCDVPTRLRKTCDVPEADGIGMDSEYDWNRGGRLACGFNESRGWREDDVDRDGNQFGGEPRKLLYVSRPLPHDDNIATLNVAKVTQARPQSHGSTKLRSETQEPNNRDFHLRLRARRERPRSGAAEQRDELASLHSITSSAATSRFCGSVTPRAFAVLRLITSWNLVGCSTGRSAGLA